MADNQHSEGYTLTLTAPSGGVESGSFYLIGDLLVVAQADADAGDEFEGACVGAHRDCPADSDTAFTAGDALYWDDTDGKVYDAEDGGSEATAPFVGHAAVDKASSDTTCVIRLQPSE